MAQRRRERIVPATEERYNEDSDEGSSAGEGNDGRREDEAAVGGVREGQATLSEGGSMGCGRASNELRTALEEMEVGEE